jgi:hypothetical protein
MERERAISELNENDNRKNLSEILGRIGAFLLLLCCYCAAIA